MDTQAIEIIGRNRLVNELLQAGLEVALPLRDRGIDLIAYADTGEGLTSFVACPIQMKAASGKAFSIDRKYEKFPNLILAFVWNVGLPNEAETYALTHAEAVAVGDEMGWTLTASWEKGLYSTSSPSRKLLGLLEPYRMTPEAWRRQGSHSYSRSRKPSGTHLVMCLQCDWIGDKNEEKRSLVAGH